MRKATLRLVAAAFWLAGAVTWAEPAEVTQQFPHRVTNGLADLRNDLVVGAAEQARARGRRLLEEAAVQHGLEAWRAHSTVGIIGIDRWPEPGPWWPQQHQRVGLEQLLGTFTSRVRLLDGPAEGEIWGLQAWLPYHVRSGRTEFLEGQSLSIEFYMPTLQYFNELVFRLLGAPFAADAGEAELGGRRYRRVFVTWGDGEPTADADQYVLWIAVDSGMVERAHYTVRDASRLSFVPEEQRPIMLAGGAGTIHYSDYREVDGVWFPFVQVVTMFGPEQSPEPTPDTFVHKFVAESVTFDSVSVAELVPEPARGRPADAKPGQ